MNFRQVRKKIKSISNVKKITQAMQLVSAVKMKKAQQKAQEAVYYNQFLEKSIRKFIPKVDKTVSKLLSRPQTAEKKLVIFISTNKGLCGAFNFNLLRLLLKKDGIKNSDFVTFGKKGALLLSQLGGRIEADFSSDYEADKATAVMDFCLELYLEGRYSEISLYYNKFVSALRSDPVEEVLLPITNLDKVDIKEFSEDYLVEPPAEEIIDTILKNYIEEKLRFAILQSEAGEHSARMLAMKNATDNANELILNLTLLGNKLRQQKITYELLDMITAKESVEGL